MFKHFLLIFVIAITLSNELIAQCNSAFSLGNDTTFCEGNTLILDAGNGFDTYNWQNGSGLQTFEVTSTGMYSCTVTNIDFSTNLIANGDFEQGNMLFTSDYTYLLIDDVTGPNGVYGVTTNPNTWFNPFSACPDHTTGTGNMMVMDGSVSNGGNDAIWCQNVPVTSNTNYSFRYWSQSVTGAPYANIRAEINGVVLGSSLAPNVICDWEETDYTWNSAMNTTAQICLYDSELAGNGNDFTFDDIGLYTICEYSDNISVTIIAADTVSNSETICQGDSILLGGAMQTSAGIYYDNIENTACLEVRETTLSISPTPAAIVPTDMVINSGETIEIIAGTALLGSTYEWTNDAGLFETNASFFSSPITTTEYYLTVTRNSCTDMDTFKVIIFEEGKEIFLPTAFSPNNDNVNDVFQVINTDEFSEIEMGIYNRWGERVFYEVGENPAWDGTHKGKQQAVTTYIYYLKAQPINDTEQITLVGNVSVVR